MSGNMWLAQLMQDMQDPEMMAEANKMMQSPAFQAQMKSVMQNPAFTQAMSKTQEMMKDPQKVQEMTSKMEKAISQGKTELEAAKMAAGDIAKEEASSGDDMPEIPDIDEKKPAK
mmetsp:Transcript_29208/g.35598  ORF Transcript_29208/g.35598 Transcript_29208/m.35598 type:complete len:115 (+) Transcript_29208:190-534(+)|eukprot:CAMPEP_0172499984 /NCGR_PEP_ID=MMETSP1066-20121228/133149_1 /TAXON_ID=671091 /ORGANISM="Coscinodiscus wailesii, Strain CCMP2513" /LENGTH=114 /DNA_ID=CAMNT_0013274003 /DNA_START=190 /DNA_END=534 /DNA_ORIENTATION=-